MSISSINGSIPSLVDYLTNSGAKSASTTMSYLGADISQGGLAGFLNGNGGDSVNFSPEALAMAQGNVGDADGGTAAKEAAQSFFLDFFKESGVDIDKLTPEAKNLLQSIGNLVTEMGSVSRDSATDNMTKAYIKGERESFTLAGNNERMSFTVQYKDGKPASMTVMQLNGGNTSKAVISLEKDAQNKLTNLIVESERKQYGHFGNLMATTEGTPLDVDLYA